MEEAGHYDGFPIHSWPLHDVASIENLPRVQGPVSVSKRLYELAQQSAVVQGFWLFQKTLIWFLGCLGHILGP